MPHILVTNDDGVQAPGLQVLAAALRPLGEVTVLAPERNWSASGHVKTLHKPLRVKPCALADGSPALACTGAPSDAVALALLGLLERPVDLVVSGINPHANLGHDVTYSGTVTAAMEACIFGQPALAVSTEHDPALGYGPAAAEAAALAAWVLREGLPKGLLLNVNVPTLPSEQIRGRRLTHQGQRVYRDALVTRLDPRGQPYHWIGGEHPDGLAEPGTDIAALREGWVSITPLHLDLTAAWAFDRLGPLAAPRQPTTPPERST